MLTLALIGRPNVGKSTLFNRLTGKKWAITHDTPGVTRDWREAYGQLLDQKIRVIDTAGLEDKFDDSIEARMREQTERGLAEADIVLFMIDGREGVTATDEYFASWARRQNKPVLLLMNKCETERVEDNARIEAYALGLGEPIPVSAAHGYGLDLIYESLMPHFDKGKHVPEVEDYHSGINLGVDIDALEDDENFDFIEAVPDEDDGKPIRFAITGRPNAGKSTLMNALLQQDRVMTGPEAGLTRDAIAVDWEYEGQRFRLVDTAGLRKKARIDNQIEEFAVQDTMRAIRLSQIVVVMIDATKGFEKQDFQIAAHVIEEGRCLVIALNKWDLVKDKKAVLDEIEYQMSSSLAQIRNIPTVPMSALRETNLDLLMETAMKAYATWNKRISTGKINRWLEQKISQTPPPMVNGRPNRMRYMTQINIRPPTFAIWMSKPDALPDSYQRYLMNGLREDYGLQGTPIRFLLRTTKNPFVKK
jgi:GTP-binding protein